MRKDGAQRVRWRGGHEGLLGPNVAGDAAPAQLESCEDDATADDGDEGGKSFMACVWNGVRLRGGDVSLP